MQLFFHMTTSYSSHLNISFSYMSMVLNTNQNMKKEHAYIFLLKRPNFFYCINVNTSITSHFLFLKIISFMCFQVYHITVIRNILHTYLPRLSRTANVNPKKCCLGILWCTSYTPSHVSHIFQILPITEHVKNKFLRWHRGL